MSDTEATFGLSRSDQRLEAGNLAGGFVDLEAMAVERCDAGRIVSAVLQPPEGRQQKRHRVTMADVADDAAHRVTC